MQDHPGRYSGSTQKVHSLNGEELHIRHGYGSYHYTNSTFSYEGEWVNGVKHGRGVMRIGGGGETPHAIYEGTFVQGEIDGEGTQRWFNSKDANTTRSYSGQFSHGSPHGEGIELYNGTKYEGSFQHGCRSGRGLLTTNKGWYQGEFEGHKKHGEGECHWQQQLTEDENTTSSTSSFPPSYTGTYSNNLRDGSGTELYADGSTYAGGFQGDVRSGYGIYTQSMITAASAPTDNATTSNLNSSSIKIEGDFFQGQPCLKPVWMKVRVVNQPELFAASAAVPQPAATAATAAMSVSGEKKGSSSDTNPSVTSESTVTPITPSSATATPSAAKPSGHIKLSKKKQEELRRQQESELAYRSTLTEGVIELNNDPSQTIALIDERRVITVTPGERLPTYYLCACTLDGTIVKSESGRQVEVTLKKTPLTAAQIEEQQAEGKQQQQQEEEVPVIAFCTCNKSTPVHDDSEQQQQSHQQRSSNVSTPLNKKKPTTAASSSSTAASTSSSSSSSAQSKSSSAQGKVRPTVAAVVVNVQSDVSASNNNNVVVPTAPLSALSTDPSPSFICDGSCVTSSSGEQQQQQLCTSIRLTLNNGYAVLENIWLSAACSPGVPLDLIVRDLTVEDETPYRLNLSVVPDELGSQPQALKFSRCTPYRLQFLTAGIVPKRRKATKGGAMNAAAKSAAVTKAAQDKASALQSGKEV